MPKKNKKVQRGRKKGSRVGRVREQTNAYMPNPRSIVLPNEVDTQLVYTFASVINSGSLTGICRRWTPNGAYDVDPTFGSTSTVGFSEMMSIFSYYRVIAYQYEFDVVNVSNIPLLVTVINTNTDPGTGTGLALQAGNQYSQQSMLSLATGGSARHVFRGRHKVADIVGSMDVETDDTFRGTSITNPGDVVYLALGIDGIGNVLTAGAYYNLRIKMLTRFFDRKSLTA